MSLMATLMLASRNLLRNRRRSLATVGAVAVGSASILLFGGYSANIRYSMETAHVRTGGHLQIQHRDFLAYGSGNPTAYGIRDHARLVDSLLRDDVLRNMVVVATPTLQFGGIAGNYAAGVSKTVVGFGLVPADQERLRAWNHYQIPLKTLSFGLSGTRPDSALIGVGVARVLQLCAELRVSPCPAAQKEALPTGAALPSDVALLSESVGVGQKDPGREQGSGTRIELLASTARGTPNVAALQVVQAEGQGFKELDEVYVAVHLGQAQRLVYGSGVGRATAVVVQLRSPKDLEAARVRIQAELPSWSGGQALTVLDLHELNPFFVQTIQLFATLFSFIFALIGGIVLFTISNTMNAAVVERTVEIGTLRAMGVRRGGIRRLFVLEGLLLGLGGAAVGVAGALGLSALLNAVGLQWFPPGSAEPLPLVFRVWGETGTIAGVGAGLVLVAVASAWWPAYRASKLSIVDALRHV